MSIKTKIMNRIDNLFKTKNKDILSIYFCAGDPTPSGTADVIRSLERNGVDLVEIGMPFSDPLADGPVIQAASTRSLKGGMSVRKLFGQLEEIRKDVSIPLIIMGYLNPIMQYGFEAFCKKCNDVGVDGLIIPDLPLREYEEHYRETAKAHNIDMIMLITPETEEERIRKIDNDSENGFIYMVSSASTTGAQKEFDAKKQEYFARIDGMNLRHPRMIGFGISNEATYKAAASHAAGVIIGSKFVTLLNETKNPDKAMELLLKDIGRKA